MNTTQLCAKRLKNLREYNNYTQSYVADYLEISQNAYSLIEKGTTKITLDRLEQFAALYKVKPVDLITEEETPFGIQNKSQYENHSNKPPQLSVLEKKMYEQHIERLEGNVEKLYEMINNITQQLAQPTLDLRDKKERVL